MMRLQITTVVVTSIYFLITLKSSALICVTRG